MHQLAWVRLMLARHPSIYWLTVGMVAAAVALGAARAVEGVDAARRSWGSQQTVWVATAPIEPGEPIRSLNRLVPSAVVPVDVVSADPAGTLARQRVGPGEIITNADISTRGTSGLVPLGGWRLRSRRALASSASVITSMSMPAANWPPPVWSSAQSDAALMVAVPTDAASVIATALLSDAVTLALTPWP